MSEAQDADSSGTEDLNESIRECSERLKTEREYLNKSRERKRKRLIKELDDELQTTRLKNQKLEQEFKEKQEKLADLRKDLRENVKAKEENNKKLGTLLNQKKEAELANERESLDVFGEIDEDILKEAVVCKVCLDSYNSTTRMRVCLTVCGHQFCMQCVTSLAEKNCPSCRAVFLDHQILKLY